MKYIKLKNSLICFILLLSSCSSVKNTIYFQDVDRSSSVEHIAQDYEVRIHKDDLLAILVNSRNPELALPFNMPMVSYQIGSKGTSQQKVLGYLVDSNGDIDFPILGRIHVSGMSRKELTAHVKALLIENDLIKDPIVTVQFLNFKVSVMGEVARPGNFEVTGDRITLLEALSMAGDLTIYGRRDRIAVIREEEGMRKMQYHDIRSSDIFKSPYYYLQQNDIVYVEPNKRKAQQSDINQNHSIGVLVSVVSILTSIAVLIWK